jgi:hypothetical protein
MEDDGSLIIKGIRIDPSVLRKSAAQPCANSRCMAACCSGGVWLREDEAPRILEWASAVKACLPIDRHHNSTWFTPHCSNTYDSGNPELGTTTVEDPLRPGRTCCVFLQPDRKCALQVVSRANQLGWPGLKPYYCAIFPLYIESGVLTVDETPLEHENLNCPGPVSWQNAIYELYRDEAVLILGEAGYCELLQKAAAQESA